MRSELSSLLCIRSPYRHKSLQRESQQRQRAFSWTWKWLNIVCVCLISVLTCDDQNLSELNWIMPLHCRLTLPILSLWHHTAPPVKGPCYKKTRGPTEDGERWRMGTKASTPAREADGDTAATGAASSLVVMRCDGTRPCRSPSQCVSWLIL